MSAYRMVLGVDPSTHTGWSLQAQSKDGLKCDEKTGEINFPGKQAGFVRSMYLAGEVSALVSNYHPDLVVFEGYAFGAQHNNYLQVEIGTLMRERIYTSGTPYITVTPGSLKKFATGSGAAKKEQVMLQVFKRWGFEAKTNNEADAYVLARIGLAYLDPLAVGLTKSQAEVIAVLRKATIAVLRKEKP